MPKIDISGPEPVDVGVGENKNIYMSAPYWAWVDQKAEQSGSNRSRVIAWLVRAQMAAESVQSA